jgi:hypothetical protein
VISLYYLGLYLASVLGLPTGAAMLAWALCPQREEKSDVRP